MGGSLMLGQGPAGVLLDQTAWVRQALLDMDDPDLLASFPRKGFIPASNADFQPILDTARELKLVD